MRTANCIQTLKVIASFARHPDSEQVEEHQGVGACVSLLSPDHDHQGLLSMSGCLLVPVCFTLGCTHYSHISREADYRLIKQLPRQRFLSSLCSSEKVLQPRDLQKEAHFKGGMHENIALHREF